MRCSTCDEPLVAMSIGITQTSAGFFSPPGHDHDDNGMWRDVWCANGHRGAMYLRRTCAGNYADAGTGTWGPSTQTTSCDWKGRDRDNMVEAWPDLPTRSP